MSLKARLAEHERVAGERELPHVRHRHERAHVRIDDRSLGRSGDRESIVALSLRVPLDADRARVITDLDILGAVPSPTEWAQLHKTRQERLPIEGNTIGSK